MGSDIPEARRVVALRPARPLWRQRLLGAGAGVLVLAVTAAVVFQQPLRRWLAPPPVAGLTRQPAGCHSWKEKGFRLDLDPQTGALLSLQWTDGPGRDACRLSRAWMPG